METPTRTGFEKWQAGIDKAVDEARWNALDCEIQATVDGFNRHLLSTPQYRMLDWRMIKAMIWVESGAANPEWDRRPMRIGVPGDPGLTSLLTGDEGGNLILPAAWKRKLTAGSARTTPRNNIRAGVGFLLMRMARYTYRSEPSADAEIRQWVVKPGDSLARIAKTQGSTIDELKKLNPSITVLQPGRTLKYRRASVQRVISGWRVISTTSIAQFYNGGRDPNYAKKLDYALSLIRTQETTSCTR